MSGERGAAGKHATREEGYGRSHVGYDTAAMTASLGFATFALAVGVGGATLAQAPKKVEIVSVTGCLREQGANTWVVVAATDPVPSLANQAQKGEIPATPPAGKNRFRLIGVGEFGLPSYRDKTVVVRGLFIKATPLSRINMTSIVEAAPACARDAPK